MLQNIFLSFLLLVFSVLLPSVSAQALRFLPTSSTSSDGALDPYPPGVDICYAIGQQEFMLYKLTLDEVKTIQQDDKQCTQFFYLEIDDKNYQQNQYLIIELELTDYTPSREFTPLFIGKTGVVENFSILPMIRFTDSSVYIDAKYQDQNAFVNRKAYMNIVIPPSATMLTSSTNARTKTFHGFALYKYYDRSQKYMESSISYTLKARFSADYPCPQACSKHGSCDQKLQRCICDEGYFDLDCSIRAKKLKVDEKVSEPVLPQVFTYFYANTTDLEGDLVLETNKTKGDVRMVVMFVKKDNFTLPNFDYNNGISSLLLNNEPNTETFKAETLKEQNAEKLLIGFFNLGTGSINMQLRIQIEEIDDFGDDAARSAIMYAMIGLSSLLLVLWAVFSVVRYKIYRDAEAIRRAAMAAETQATYLTKEELDAFFPKTDYKNLRSSFPQPTCSICLEDFVKGAVCRQLTCEHVYHGPCIEVWLTSHNDCPNCKKDMSREAVEKALDELKKLSSEENKLHQRPESDIPVATENLNRFQRSNSAISDMNSSSICLKSSNRTSQINPFDLNDSPHANGNTSYIQNDAGISSENVRDLRGRTPIKTISATVQRVAQRRVRGQDTP